MSDIILHDPVPVVKLVHGFVDLALPNVAEQIVQPLLWIRRAQRVFSSRN